jgi:tetratricopeptide (TPR) repeat protein
MAEIELQKKIRSFLDSAVKKSTVKDFDSALDDLKAAEVLDRENPEILYNLGICYTRTGLHGTAIEYFRRLLRLPYSFVDVIAVRKLLAYCLITMGDCPGALEELDKGLSLAEGDTAALNMKGYCLENAGQLKEAAALYQQILEIDHHNYNAYNSLAYILAKAGGDLTRALKYAKIALESNPGNPAYLDTVGFIYMKKGKGDMAKKYLKKAYSLLPGSEDIKSHLNQLLRIE